MNLCNNRNVYISKTSITVHLATCVCTNSKSFNVIIRWLKSMYILSNTTDNTETGRLWN